uniref:Microtubule crosslinking factor 2 n=1 Tax=Hippocampus comes TaxID=109280 RepID=A0A3Q3D7L6_HIPCM
MTKSKEVDVHNSPAHLSFASPKERRLHLRQKMESGGGREGSDSGQAQHAELPALLLAQGGKKKINRAPSPARPKDVPGWSLTKIRGGLGAPSLSVKPGAIHLGNRISRRSPSGKDVKADKNGVKPAGKSSASSANASSKNSATKMAKSSSGARRVSDASIGSDDLSKDSGCAAGKLSPTDSSSELSDCASEEHKLSSDAPSSDTESRSSRGGGDNQLGNGTHQYLAGAKSSTEIRDKDRLSVGVEAGEESSSAPEERSVTSVDSRMPASTSLAFSDLTEEFVDGMHEEFVREIEELRSENDYLKDEMEELRSEMLEMRDMYMEDDVYQLQELRQQLEQANKPCRILQYRLRKSERRSIRVAQTGQVDGELIRTLEQDVKVAKDVSIRLHSQLDSGEQKRARLEEENEELRVRLQDLEVAKQVLQQEIDKNSQKKRAARPNNKPDKKLPPQEDSSDLKCQLHFAKEESALMCKKLTKLVKDSEAMKEELAKYRSLYGDVDASITVEEVADSPHTREAEVKVHLKLVEEEANLLSRRIVELEVENRGLRAEMDDMKGPQGSTLSHFIASSENVMELQRHLQFVEEEAELLRRSLLEMEEQNKLLMNEINRYKSELPPPPPPLTSGSGTSLSERLLHDGSPHSVQEGAVLISPDVSPQEEELRVARLQIGELGGKVKKLQYENRVLLSNLQRCDLASYQPPSSSSSLRVALETDQEAGDSAECLPNSSPHRKEPLGVENDLLESTEQNNKMDKTAGPKASPCGLLGLKDRDALLAMRDQARLISTAIQLLTAPESNCLPSSPSIYHSVCSNEAAESCELEKVQPLVGALTSRLQALHGQLQVFVEHVDSLGKSSLGEGQSSLTSSVNVLSCAEDQRDALKTAEEKVKHMTFTPCHHSFSVCFFFCCCCFFFFKKLFCFSYFLFPLSNSLSIPQLHEEQQKALLRRDFQLQSLGLQARLQYKLWGQERTLLVQESRHLKEALLLLSLKLRCFLKHWRLDCKKDMEWKDILEMNNLKDLYLLLEADNLTSPVHLSGKKADGDEQTLGPAIKLNAVSSTLADLKVALQDLSGELRQERQGSQELTQQFAKAKASWEVERTELKSLITQVGKGKCSDAMDPPDLKVALKREREEHQHLLAESYAAVMDLTKQLQIGERNWGREKLELLERFSQERAQWEQRLRETKVCVTKSIPQLDDPDFRPTADLRGLVHFAAPPPLTPLSDSNKKNWTCLTDETSDAGETCKTWDGPSASVSCSNLVGSQLDLESIQRSHTAPESTGIRMYYSPPAVRRMEHQRSKREANGNPDGGSALGLTVAEAGPAEPPQPSSCFSSSYEQWLSSLSEQHRELLESRSAIAANLSDDMKEMTNCVRQAIRSSSLERKSGKEHAVGMSSRSTQTAAQCVSIGLQTENLTSSRGAGLHAKAWSPRPSSTTTSPLASARTRQISTSLDKVHSRIDRPCCSPKFGSPKLQRRVSSGSTSRLDGTPSSRERSLWNLQQRAMSGGGGSAWARSTTTRDSPVLSGLTDGLSSLFSVVEHSGSTETLWRARHPHAAGKPSCASVCAADPNTQRFGGLVQEFLQNVCSGRSFNCVDELKPECLPAAVGGLGALAGLCGGTDNVTRIVNKRFMRQTTGDEMVSIMGGGGGKDGMGSTGSAGSGTEVRESNSTML